MAAGPVGSVWEGGSWTDTCWTADTWDGAVPPTPGQNTGFSYGYRNGLMALVGAFWLWVWV